MEGPITDSAREAMLLAAVARIEPRTLKESLQLAADPRVPISKPVVNALAALRKQRDPASVLGRAQYRAALPYAAAVFAEPCLEAVIGALGDDADDPSREQLLAAVQSVEREFDDTTVTVMLASVADGDMAASDLCFTLLDSDERYGIEEWRSFERAAPTQVGPAPAVPSKASVEQREARRARKHREAEERRRKADATARAAEQVRQTRKRERLASADRPPAVVDAAQPAPVLPTMGRRRAVLSPIEEEEFDRDDPWSAGVVLAWVPFDAKDPDHPDLDGKVRPCVVLAGSPTHLLVRPGYSAGGVKSRDWKSLPVRHWRRSGFEEPTWIDVDPVRVGRPDTGPAGFLEADDWNALW